MSWIYFSDSYHQVELDKSSFLKIVFSTSGKGFIAYARMTLGLCNSGSILYLLAHKVIGCDLKLNVFVYLDDIVITTET